jgi:hypothetical protein
VFLLEVAYSTSCQSRKSSNWNDKECKGRDPTTACTPGRFRTPEGDTPHLPLHGDCDGGGTPAINRYCSITVLSLRTTRRRGKEEKSEQKAQAQTPISTQGRVAPRVQPLRRGYHTMSGPALRVELDGTKHERDPSAAASSAAVSLIGCSGRPAVRPISQAYRLTASCGFTQPGTQFAPAAAP